MTRKFVFRHIFRSKIKTLLTLTVAALFAVALCWLSLAIAHNIHETDRLFDTTVVNFEIVQRNHGQMASRPSDGFVLDIIRPDTVAQILEGGFILSHELDTRVDMGVIAAIRECYEDVGAPQYLFHDMNRRQEGAVAVAFNHTGRVTPDTGIVRRQHYIITYADGWDESFFTEEWSLERLMAQDFPPVEVPEAILTGRRQFLMRAGFFFAGIQELNIPVIVNERLLYEHDFAFGDVFFLTGETNNIASMITCVIVGSFSHAPYFGGWGIGEVLMPLSVIEELNSIFHMNWGYSHARFDIDPSRNRELSEIRNVAENIVAEPGAGWVALHTVFWDDELRMAIEPMEQNLQLMQVLYPVTLTVSVLISAGLALLLNLLKANVSAMLRVLGASKLRVRFILCFEHFVVSFVGLCFGLLFFTAISGISPLPDLPPFGHIGMYLLGAVIGSICGAVLVSNRMPLELLQVRE